MLDSGLAWGMHPFLVEPTLRLYLVPALMLGLLVPWAWFVLSRYLSGMRDLRDPDTWPVLAMIILAFLAGVIVMVQDIRALHP